MNCDICQQVMDYPEDEIVFDDERNFQEAMDTGYQTKLCLSCYY